MPTNDLQDNWLRICEKIATYADVNQPQFNAFANRIQIQAMSEGFVLLTTENSFLKSWVEKNLVETIERALKDIYGIPFALAVEVDEAIEGAQNLSAPASSEMPVQPIPQQPSSLDGNETIQSNQIFVEADAIPSIEEANKVIVDDPSHNESPSKGSPSISLNPIGDQAFRTLTFENYVIGESNRMAYSMAVQVAETPGRAALNPLFIYGKSGLGKTHLMRAIQNYINATQPLLKVVYTDSEELLSEYTNAVAEHDKEKSSYKNFKTKYESADVLLIDDIQFLQGKIQTLDIVFQIFNKLINQGKQIVLSADRAPKNIDIEERYSSRFMQGGTIDIQPPEIETKLAIVKSYIKEYRETEGDANLTIPENIQMYIAENSGSNIRELKGAVNIVIYHINYSDDKELTISDVNSLLENHFSGMISKNLTIGDIQKEVENYYRIKHSDMIGSSRVKEIAFPRHVAIYLCRQLLDLPYEVIGKKFNRNHTTAMNSVTTIDKMLLTNRDVQEEIETLKQIIREL